MSSSNQGSHDIILPITIDEYFRSHRFDELKEYLNITEKYLEKAKSDFETSYDKKAKILSNANPDLSDNDINDFLSDDYHRLSETFPRILRSSFLVSAISLFENEIEQIFKRIKKDREIPIDLSDLNGNFRKKILLYCKLAKLSVSFDNPTWNEINNYYMLRNCIVHNNGIINGFRDEKTLIMYSKKQNIVDELYFFPHIRPTKVIALSEQYCKEVIEVMQNFLVELEKKIAKIT